MRIKIPLTPVTFKGPVAVLGPTQLLCDRRAVEGVEEQQRGVQGEG